MSEAFDVRVERGMERQLAARRARIDVGARPIGWKVGFGSAAAMAGLGISAPLVGFLTDAGIVAEGSTYSISGWTQPMLEPEVAVRIAGDVRSGSSRDEVETAIAAVGPAIELVDVDPPPTDVEEICAGNIYHRGVALGPTRPGASLAGATGRVFTDGIEAAYTADPQELPGEVVPLVAQVADVLGALGERLRAGDVVITGSIVTPLAIRAGSTVRYELDPLGTIELTFAS
jgi:2-keto-4-pentenoate hydratase